VFEDRSGVPPGAAWHRVQPVVQGDRAFFDAGLSCSLGSVPAQRLDLDMDGTPESVDIAVDGFVELIDPSGRGLGLTHAGEILSSPLPGRGAAPLGHVSCAGLPVRDGETARADGLDDDGDTIVDCADADCCGDPACAAVLREGACDDGVDGDCDTLFDCVDAADCATDPACAAGEDCDSGVDDDGDTDVDCADADCCGDPACAAVLRERSCSNGIDEDCDTLVDCEDADDCDTDPACRVEECANGVDDDGDGDADCLDADCCVDAACLAPPGEAERVEVRRDASSREAMVVTWRDDGSDPGVVFDVLTGVIGEPGRAPFPSLWWDRGFDAAA
jgi:hypothetical protein